jgi:deoxyribodipyrimidine photo-lyase
MQAVDIIWIRNDLRFRDNPALSVGAQGPSVLVFTADGVGIPTMGAASRVYLHHALLSFQKDLKEQYEAPLLIFPSIDTALQKLQRVVRVERVLWNRSYEPTQLERDLALEDKLKAQGIKVGVCRGSILFEPWEIKNKSGQPFKVFTPFYKAFLARGAPAEAIGKPKKIISDPNLSLPEGSVDALRLLPEAPRWDRTLMKGWPTSEDAWWKAWKSFRQHALMDYPRGRDLPAVHGTSRMSVPLHYGQISPRVLFAEARAHANAGTETWLRQLVWREFAIASLFHQPTMDRAPIIAAFQQFPWDDEEEHRRAWQRGRTGYPIVDAGMRELWQTGWMHNRVRMIVGSFLVKNLHLNWTEGSAFFWDTLIDADRANNAMGWQWVAGCGIDPSPYFRIFNPSLQSERFDPEGDYIKRWVPELQELPPRWIHSPWKAPAKIRALAPNYPEPIVDFAESRQQALMFYDRIKSGRATASP